MTATVLLGWAMTVIGLLFLLLAFTAASKNVFRRGMMVPESATTSGSISQVFKYLALVFRELSKLPFWIACLLAGLVLIFLGQRLVNGHTLFSL